MRGCRIETSSEISAGKLFGARGAHPHCQHQQHQWWRSKFGTPFQQHWTRVFSKAVAALISHSILYA